MHTLPSLYTACRLQTARRLQTPSQDHDLRRLSRHTEHTPDIIPSNAQEQRGRKPVPPGVSLGSEQSMHSRHSRARHATAPTSACASASASLPQDQVFAWPTSPSSCSLNPWLTPSSKTQPLQTDWAVLRNSTPSPPLVPRTCPVCCQPQSLTRSCFLYLLTSSHIHFCSFAILRQARRQNSSSLSRTPLPPVCRIPTRFLQSPVSTTQPGLGLIRPDLTRLDLVDQVAVPYIHDEKALAIAPLLTAFRLSIQIDIRLACTISTKLSASVATNSVRLTTHDIIHEPGQLRDLKSFLDTHCHSGTATSC